MRHVADQQRTDLVGDLAERGEVPQPRIGGGAGHDHLGAALTREGADLVEVDEVGLAVDVIGHEVVVLAAEVHRRPVGQVAALVEREAQDRVAALEQRVIDGHVRLRAGMRLDVDVLGAEELLRAIAGEVLRDIDDLAAAVVAAPGIALRVLAGENRPHRLEHGERRVVLRRDELEVRSGSAPPRRARRARSRGPRSRATPTGPCSGV